MVSSCRQTGRPPPVRWSAVFPFWAVSMPWSSLVTAEQLHERQPTQPIKRWRRANWRGTQRHPANQDDGRGSQRERDGTVVTFSKLYGFQCRTAHKTLPTMARGKPAGDTTVTSMPCQWEEGQSERDGRQRPPSMLFLKSYFQGKFLASMLLRHTQS